MFELLVSRRVRELVLWRGGCSRSEGTRWQIGEGGGRFEADIGLEDSKARALALLALSCS